MIYDFPEFPLGHIIDNQKVIFFPYHKPYTLASPLCNTSFDMRMGIDLV